MTRRQNTERFSAEKGRQKFSASGMPNSWEMPMTMSMQPLKGFFISSINGIGALLGRAPGLQLPQWLAPFGISYYTLILTGYLLDVRWETVEQGHDGMFS